MADVIPTGMYSKPLSALAELLADCESFQTWVGVPAENAGTPTGVTAAKERIHFIAYEDPKEGEPGDSVEECLANRPLAIVGFGGDAEAERQTEPPSYDHSQTIELSLENAQTGDNERDIFLNFMNNAGDIFAEIEELTGTDGHLLISRHRIIEGPGRPTDQLVAEGELPVIGATWEIEWSQ